MVENRGLAGHMAEQAPSIVDVAHRAGVSIATASRVMSGSTYPVSEAARQKVLDAAAELNYIPNSMARSLRTQRSKLIAVMVGDNSDPYFAEIARGVEAEANTHGYLTIICNTERDPHKELQYLRSLQDYRIDGVIFAGGGLDLPGHSQQLATIADHMQKRGGAVITLSPHTLAVPSVQIDNLGGAESMTTHLLALGHRRIVFITGPADLLTATERLHGYQSALANAGIAVDPTLVLPGDFTRESGERAVSQLVALTGDHCPTAIFAANDETAFGVLQGLTRCGLRVPQDYAVVGFGDLSLTRFTTPTLTTVHVDLRELGRMGTERLLRLLHKEQVPSLSILTTTIVERESTSQM
jgi:LacI family transcriptional regulator